MATNNSESIAQQKTVGPVDQLSATLQSLASLTGGDASLRAMCAEWCALNIERELLLSRDEVIAALLQQAATAGRRIGKMQHDAQRRVSELRGARARSATYMHE